MATNKRKSNFSSVPIDDLGRNAARDGMADKHGVKMIEATLALLEPKRAAP